MADLSYTASKKTTSVTDSPQLTEMRNLVAYIKSDNWVVDPRLRSGMATQHLGTVQDAVQHNFAKDVVLHAVDQIGGLHPQIAAVLKPIRDVIIAVLPEHNSIGMVVDQLQQLHTHVSGAERDLHDAEKKIAQRWVKGSGAVTIMASVVQLRMQVTGGALVSAGVSLAVTHAGALTAVAASAIMALITPILQWVQHNAMAALTTQGPAGLATVIQQATKKLQAVTADIQTIGRAVVKSNGNLLTIAQRLASGGATYGGKSPRTGWDSPSKVPPGFEADGTMSYVTNDPVLGQGHGTRTCGPYSLSMVSKSIGHPVEVDTFVKLMAAPNAGTDILNIEEMLRKVGIKFNADQSFSPNLVEQKIAETGRPVVVQVNVRAYNPDGTPLLTRRGTPANVQHFKVIDQVGTVTDAAGDPRKVVYVRDPASNGGDGASYIQLWNSFAAQHESWVISFPH